jgi:hypothetical protein
VRSVEGFGLLIAIVIEIVIVSLSPAQSFRRTPKQRSKA